jgi:hypothetical protein
MALIWLVLGRQSETGPWHATSTFLTMPLLEAKDTIRALVGDAAFPVGHCLGIIKDDGRTPAALALVGPADGHFCKKAGGTATPIPGTELEAALVAIAEQRAREAALVAIAEQRAREAAGLSPLPEGGGEPALPSSKKESGAGAFVVVGIVAAVVGWWVFS